MLRIRLLLLLVLCAAGWQHAEAQLTDLVRSRYGVASYYKFEEPGDITITVNAWGTIRNPGLYEIPQGTRLTELLSMAGGPVINVRRKRDTYTVRVRLFRQEEGQQRSIYESEMQNEVLATAEDPVLEVGDVITVETITRQGLSWRDIFPIVGAVASLGLIVERFTQ